MRCAIEEVSMEAAGLLLTGWRGYRAGVSHAGGAGSLADREGPNPRARRVGVRRDESSARQGDLPIFAICKGLQVFNVALGGTLRLDIPGHNAPEMRDHDVQQLRTAADATHRFEKVNSSHHQAIDRLGGRLRGRGVVRGRRHH